ncbi:MAG: hypothetical protein WC058_05355 [Phycisphaeraceae bacterium]
MRQGGKLHPEHGLSKRIEDQQKVRALSKHIRRGVFITLTINRDHWTREAIRQRYQRMNQTERDKARLTAERVERLPVEEIAYRVLSSRVSLCMSRRLGFKVWVRVIEPQTTSGDGWIHWHIIAEAWGTQWCKSGGFVALKRLAAALWATWGRECEGGRPDLQLVRNPDRLASYVSKYVTKGWPAIPPWLLECERSIRLVGFSKAAGDIVRQAMNIQPQRRLQADHLRKRRKRSPGKLLDRLCGSGMSCVVIQNSRYVGSLNVPWESLFMLEGRLPELNLVHDEYETFRGDVVSKPRFVLQAIIGSRQKWCEFVGRVFDAARELGVGEIIDVVRQRVRDRFANGWQKMQAA